MILATSAVGAFNNFFQTTLGNIIQTLLWPVGIIFAIHFILKALKNSRNGSTGRAAAEIGGSFLILMFTFYPQALGIVIDIAHTLFVATGSYTGSEVNNAITNGSVPGT